MLDLLDAGIKPQDLSPFATVCEHEDVEFDMGSATRGPEARLEGRGQVLAELRALRPPAFHEATPVLSEAFDDSRLAPPGAP